MTVNAVNPTSDILQALAAVVGDANVLTGTDDLIHFGKDWTKAWAPAPLAIVLPRSTAEVQAIVQLANEREFAIVPSGGRTGLSGGAVAANGEVVVAFDKMNQIRDFNAIDRSVVVGAGVV